MIEGTKARAAIARRRKSSDGDDEEELYEDDDDYNHAPVELSKIILILLCFVYIFFKRRRTFVSLLFLFYLFVCFGSGTQLPQYRVARVSQKHRRALNRLQNKASR